MLHWNSWWVQKDNLARHGDAEPPMLLPHDPAAWTPEGWLAWQFNLWNQSWKASLAWWRLFGVTAPVMSWPPSLVATTIVEPEETPPGGLLATVSLPAADETEASAKPRSRVAASRRNGRVAESRTAAQPPR